MRGDYNYNVPSTRSFVYVTHLRPQPAFIPRLTFLAPRIRASGVEARGNSTFVSFPIGMATVRGRFDGGMVRLGGVVRAVGAMGGSDGMDVAHVDVRKCTSPSNPLRLGRQLTHRHAQALGRCMSRLCPFSNGCVRAACAPRS